jgi:hypothetical protein
MILLVPADHRPHTFDLPLSLGALAGDRIEIPPPEALPHLNQPGRYPALRAWLLERAASARALIVSLETLTLGGMIPARRESTPLAVARERLGLLSELRRAYPRLRIYAFGVILRVATGDDPWEEKPYYAQFGPQIRAYSELVDRIARGELAGRAEDRVSLPPEVLEDYLATRHRNRVLLQEALDLAAQGVLEQLFLGLDDTAPYSLSAVDRRELEAQVERLGIWDRVRIHPGADELASTLVARCLLDEKGYRPQVWVEYPSVLAERAELRYEDRVLGELVRAHLYALGLSRARDPEAAGLFVAVNAPARRQGEAAYQPDWVGVETADRHLDAFVVELERALDRKERVVLLDVAYANGADLRLMRRLQHRLPELWAYAGWNTAGNTLGGGLALALAALFGQDPRPRLEALFLRLADDWLYQAEVRQEVSRSLAQVDPYDLGELWPLAEQEVTRRLAPRVEALWEERFAHLPWRLHLKKIRLPWPRLFSVALDLVLEAECR